MNHGTACRFLFMMFSFSASRKMPKSGAGISTPGNRSEMMPSNSGTSYQQTHSPRPSIMMLANTADRKQVIKTFEQGTVITKQDPNVDDSQVTAGYMVSEISTANIKRHQT